MWAYKVSYHACLFSFLGGVVNLPLLLRCMFCTECNKCRSRLEVPSCDARTFCGFGYNEASASPHCRLCLFYNNWSDWLVKSWWCCVDHVLLNITRCLGVWIMLTQPLYLYFPQRLKAATLAALPVRNFVCLSPQLSLSGATLANAVHRHKWDTQFQLSSKINAHDVFNSTAVSFTCHYLRQMWL